MASLDKFISFVNKLHELIDKANLYIYYKQYDKLESVADKIYLSALYINTGVASLDKLIKLIICNSNYYIDEDDLTDDEYWYHEMCNTRNSIESNYMIFQIYYMLASIYDKINIKSYQYRNYYDKLDMNVHMLYHNSQSSSV